jgi:hypothetical protein
MRGFISNNIVLACGNAKVLTHYYREAKCLGYCNCNCRVRLICLEELGKLICFQSNESFIVKSLIRKLSVPKT